MTGDTSHGWVKPRADGARAKCGGPDICPNCQTEKMHDTMLTACFGPCSNSVQAPRKALAAGIAQSAAARDVLAERLRQVSAEGWTPERDDSYVDEQLARAAVCYALPQGDYEIPEPPEFWPWDPAWWKPGHRRRELVKAGALILAEIERLDRAALSASQQQEG